MEPRKIIILEDVHKSFSTIPVLKGVWLDILEGVVNVIIGGSGSGKSVVVKHIIGLLKPDQGKVMVEGVDISKMSEKELIPVRRKFGMLFQSGALFDSMTVLENVAFPLTEHTKLKKSEIRERVLARLHLLNLFDMENKNPAELSGGQKKRVALARALILDPGIIIYDEPTTGLDPIMSRNVDDMIKETEEKFHITSIVISHDMASTFRIGHNVSMIHDGRIIESGGANHFLNSVNPVVQSFISASNVKRLN